MRICNGRVEGNESGCFSFYNHLGFSVIDYVLVHKDSSNSISNMCVCDFNEWSDHAPIDFTVNCLLFDKNQRTDNNVSYTSFRWVANNLEQMKCELNEKMCDFHKNIDKIQAAEMTVNEGQLGTNKNANDYIEISNVEECFYQELDYPITEKEVEECFYQELDYPITEKEVQAVIANLKSKTSAGKDNLFNDVYVSYK